MRIQSQDWEPIRNGQVVRRISPSIIEFLAKVYPGKDGELTDEGWEITQRMADVPALLSKLEHVLHCFDRDDIPINRFDRPMGKGVRVFITYRQARRLRDLLYEKITPEEVTP